MRKYFCELCRSDVAEVHEVPVRTALPVEGIIDDANAFQRVDICSRCAFEILRARMVAEVETFERIYKAAREQSEDEPSDLPDDWEMPHSYYGDEEDDT